MKNLYRLIAIFALFGLLAGCAPAATVVPTITPDLTPPTFESLVPIAEQFVNELSSRNYAAAFNRFDASYKSVMTLPQLQATWEQLLGLSGAFQQQSSTRTSFVKGKPVVGVTCDFVNGTMEIQVAFNNNSQIIGMYFTQMQTAVPAPPSF